MIPLFRQRRSSEQQTAKSARKRYSMGRRSQSGPEASQTGRSAARHESGTGQPLASPCQQHRNGERQVNELDRLSPERCSPFLIDDVYCRRSMTLLLLRGEAFAPAGLAPTSSVGGPRYESPRWQPRCSQVARRGGGRPPTGTDSLLQHTPAALRLGG
jgi:hypothetical protein